MNFSVCQLPPEEAFVPLSHAVSWIAFQHSLSSQQLSVALAIEVECEPLAHVDYARTDEVIKCAVKQLTDFGSSGEVEIRGRYFRNVLDDEIEIYTEKIPPLRLADYQWFDMLDDSLFRGLGIAWGDDRRQPRYPRDDRHYRFVTVNRNDLLRKFPMKTADPIQSTGAAEADCEAWLLAAFSVDPLNRMAKSVFKAESLAKFSPRLGMRGFDRVWDKVAPADRKKAGAKLKR